MEAMEVCNIKREADGPPRKKRKKNPVSNETLVPKNPVMALNEIKPNLVYDITEKGPCHARIFEVSVTINGQCYSAEDTTKKKAKARVAQMILHSTVQLKDPTVKAPLDAAATAHFVDFSQDFVEPDSDSQNFFCSETTVREQVTKSAPPPAPVVNAPDAATSSPVYQLNRIKPGTKIEIIKEEGEPHNKKYTARGIMKMCQLKHNATY